MEWKTLKIPVIIIIVFLVLVVKVPQYGFTSELFVELAGVLGILGGLSFGLGFGDKKEDGVVNE